MGSLRASLLVGLVVSVAAGGCSSGGGSGGGTSGGTNFASKRTSTCLAWQGAVCNFLSDKCAFQARTECDNLYQALFCKDDATMQACTQELSSAACPATADLPASCKQINDPAPVAEFCDQFAVALCNVSARCDGTSVSDCVPAVQAELSSTCSSAVGLGPSADQCLADLKTVACPVDSSPQSCKGVIKTLQSPTAHARLSSQIQGLSIDALVGVVRPLESTTPQ
ncbi:MAG TPA: hypothetical protein PKA88_03810 [Polyangiaceae bacterium]|nr:hypothetical protein [Polyangiaceae bacterium]